MSNVMTPRNKYLLEAGLNWIIDNGLTPHILIDAEYPTAQLPWDFVNNGQIILNISVNACGEFFMDNDAVSFKASFGGKRQQVYIPMGAIQSIFAKENGEGFAMPEYPEYLKPTLDEPKDDDDKDDKKDDNRPTFTIVK